MADTLTATSGEGVANDKDQAPASAGDTVLSDSTTSTSLSAATDKKADASLRGEEAGNSKLAAETNEFTNVDLDDTSAVEGIPLGSPEVVQRDVVPLSRRLSEFKSWSVTHVKCARQMISERFGKGSRTVDVQLDESIQALRDTQRKYLEILAHSRRLVAQLRTNIEVQRSLGDMFAEYAVRAPELQTEFKSNCGVQRQVARNGDSLLAILEAFCSNVQTLVSKTMDDTLLKVKDYEAARVEYDAFRADLESLRAALVQNPANATKKAKLEEAEKELESHKTKYDQMRSDMAVKLRFLDENRVKVMQKQLILLHNATCAYYTGNSQELERCLQVFHIKLPPREGQAPSENPTSFQLLPMTTPLSPDTSQAPEKGEDGETTPLY